MRSSLTMSVLTGCVLLAGCAAQNPWWEASRSGWALYGMNAQVPRKAKPVPLSLMLEVATWNQPVYIEAWIDSVDDGEGAWMTVSDGTSPPVMVLPNGGFTLPRNARGRRVMAWGRPMVATGSVDDARISTSVDFVADTVMIQGYYGLEAPPESSFVPIPPPQIIEEVAPPAAPEPPTDPEPAEPAPAEPQTDDATEELAPPPIVDLPER